MSGCSAIGVRGLQRAMTHPRHFAHSAPSRPAIVMVENGDTISDADLEARANRSAHLLRALGCKRGDVVASLFGNGPEVFAFAWAAQRAGLLAVSISNRLSASDVAYLLRDSGARVLVVSDEYEGLAEQATAQMSGIEAFLWSDTTPSMGNWTASSEDFPGTPIEDETPGSDLLYSSGTTGRPKGVSSDLPEGAIDAETPLMAMGRSLYGMGEDMRYLSTSPLYHAAPLRWAMTVHRLGGTVYVMERFDAAECLALIERYAVTHGTFVPTHFVRMLKLPEEQRLAFDLSSLEAVVHAAAPCPAQVKRQMIEWLGPIVHEYYSGTEQCGITAIDSQEWLAHPGSVGRAVLGQVRIVNEDGEEVPAGQTGAVYFSGGPRFSYLNDSKKTAASHNAEGWATMGDIGHVDAEGFLYLTDRKGFMIISGGVNVYPQEIENLLVTHENVADVAVFGIPDEDLGEAVIAVVQPDDPASATPELAERLRAFARENLGGVKTPKQFHFDLDFPREATGKLMKRVLIERYA